MKIKSLLVLVATLGCTAPAFAGEWDMAPTEVAPEYNLAKYQSPINPAALGGYSIAAPQYLGQMGGLGAGAGQAYSSSGAQGTSGNTTFRTNGTGLNALGINPNSVYSPTRSQNSGLPKAGSMGLAPVFGVGNGGGSYSSAGGYVPPTIYIPFVGSYQIPKTVSVGGVSTSLPVDQP